MINVSTKDLTRENIHDLFTMVLQDTWLFEGTVKENIIYNQKNVDYTIPGARVVEDSILEYEGPQEKLKNKHDKDIIEKIIELSEKEEIRKKP